METSWTLNEKSTGELVVTVEGDAWKKAQKKAFNKVKGQINIKGFRKGQIPDALVRKQINKEYLYEMAAEDVANEALVAGIEENKIELVDRPTLTVKEADENKAVLVFNCVVSPAVILGAYKGLEVAKDVVEVTEEDIENEVKRLQDRYADWVLRDDDEAAQMGDQVTIDFVGTKDGVEFEGGTGTDYPLELGSNSFIPGFEDQLVGVKVGDVKDVNVTFPEDYNAEELAGQDAVFKVTVHDIKFKDVPEMNDELVKKAKIDGVETVEQFKENKKAELQASRERAADDKFTADVLKAAADNANVDIPDVMINSEVENIFRNFQNQMAGSGFTAEQYCQALGTTVEDLKATFRPEAETRVLNTLVLSEIAKVEELEVTDEDVEKEFQNLADTYGMDLDKVKAIVSADQIKYDVAQQKAIELIKSNVK